MKFLHPLIISFLRAAQVLAESLPAESIKASLGEALKGINRGIFGVPVRHAPLAPPPSLTWHPHPPCLEEVRHAPPGAPPSPPQ